MAVTLINVFMVEEGHEEEFLENWRKSADVFSQTPGFIETHLHRNTGVGNGTFKFINIARWKSAEAWRSTHAAYVPTEYSLAGVKGHPAIYESIVDLVQQGGEADLRDDTPRDSTLDFLTRVSASRDSE